jgi:hypothetical protein
MKVLLKIIAAVSTILLIGCKSEEEKHLTVTWYIMPPQTYRHVEDKQTDQVLQWLQGVPTTRHFFSLAQIKSPYTFDEWTEKGKKIPSAEQILIHLCKEYPGIVSYEEILEGLYYVCTHLSVSSMLEIVQGDDYDLDQQLIAARILGKIGDPVAVKPLIDLASSITIDGQAEESAYSFKINVIGALSSIGDPRIIAYLDAEIQKPYWGESRIDFLQALRKEVIKAREQFLLDWLHRAPFNLDKKNSKNLPPYPSMKMWVNAGAQIPDLERSLITFLDDKKLKTKWGIFQALRKFGTEECVPALKAIILDPNYDTEIRVKAKYALEGNESLEAIEALKEIGNLKEVESY